MMNLVVTDETKNDENATTDKTQGSKQRSSFDKTQFKVLKQWQIPDYDGSPYGTGVQVYQYQKNTPKLKIYRYGQRNGEHYDQRNVNLARPNAIRELSKLLGELADTFEKEGYSNTSDSVE